MVLNSLAQAISNLEAASDGVAMKSALVDLAETLNTLQGSDTKKLGGLGPGEYVLESELASLKRKIETMYLKYDTEPELDGKKVMKNKDITKYFGDILTKLKKINGDKNGKTNRAPADEIGGDIKECLNILNTTFGLIEDAINDKATGPDSQVQPTDSIEDLSTRIDNIKLNALTLQPLTVTEDGYEKESDIIYDENHVIISGHAYNPVTVDIKLKGQNAILTNTGNNTPDEGYDGYSSVTIQVEDSGSGSGSGGSGSGGSTTLNLKEETIDKNGEYQKPDGYDGFSTVNVEVTDYEDGEIEELTVTFMTKHSDGSEEELDKKNVYTGEDCVYDRELPKFQNDNMFEEPYFFDHWSPRPVNVKANMTCWAVYGKSTRADNAYWIDDREWATSDWYDICKGKVDPSGTCKVLTLKDGSFLTVKCCGTQGKNSIWCSFQTVPTSGVSAPGATESYGESDLHLYLNGDFLNNYMPDWIRPYLHVTSLFHLAPKLMPSSSCLGVSTGTQLLGDGHAEFDPQGRLVGAGVDYNGPTSVEVWGLDYETCMANIWIPSACELGLLNDYPGDFTNDIYVCNEFTYNGVPNPAYNTFNRLGRKKNVDFPRSLQTGLVKEKISNKSEFSYTPICGSPTNIRTLQAYYSPQTHAKGENPAAIYSEHWQVGPGKAKYDNGASGLHNVLQTRPDRFNNYNYSLLLRDRVIVRNSLQEHWGEGWEQTAYDETSGREYVKYRGNTIVRDAVPMSTGQFTYTSMTVNGCYKSNTDGAGIRIVFAIQPRSN